MTTHIVIRVTTSPTMPAPKHAAYGPCSKDEALALMDAGHRIFCDLGLYITHSDDSRCITGRKKGGATTWKLLLVEIYPPTEDVCEGIS